MRVEELFNFIAERQNIYVKKEAGLEKPWSDDPIFQNYKFCNVYRENDRVTKWIAENWRDAHQEDEYLWMAMAIARYVNWPETLAEMKYPNWKKKAIHGNGEPHWKETLYCVLENRKARGDKVFGNAYMITTHRHKVEKNHYVVNAVLATLWDDRTELTAGNFSTLKQFHAALAARPGVGSFMAAQIIADVKYARPYNKISDWYTFAASGPGSRRGLNRVFNQHPDSPWTEQEWKYLLDQLLFKLNSFVQDARLPSIHAQDLQNCLCEFDKYERIRLNEGRIKARYPGLPTTTSGEK